MVSDELKEKISKIKIWQRSGERAPHKPLLFFRALDQLTKGEFHLVSYEKG
jgi:predicted restriction endonuclease